MSGLSEIISFHPVHPADHGLAFQVLSIFTLTLFLSLAVCHSTSSSVRKSVGQLVSQTCHLYRFGIYRNSIYTHTDTHRAVRWYIRSSALPPNQTVSILNTWIVRLWLVFCRVTVTYLHIVVNQMIISWPFKKRFIGLNISLCIFVLKCLCRAWMSFIWNIPWFMRKMSVF